MPTYAPEQRLVKCGFTAANASGMCANYAGDYRALEEYIRFTELLTSDEREYPKEV